ncbi:MAG: LEA type 2 family protein [Granulosicoccus sp.]
MAITSCSSIPASRPEAPKVTIESVKLAKLGLKQQELDFKLNVFNPNEYALPVRQLEFTASHEDTPFATGTSSDAVKLIPGETIQMDVRVTTRLNKMFSRLLGAMADNESSLKIKVSGFVKLDNWPVRIPFETDRTVDTPSLNDLNSL